jgi:pimeloyl-ACP methyl ester carboxylesterase
VECGVLNQGPELQIGEALWDRVQVRVSGPSEKPALIYLPGLHGDWMLVGSFKAALGESVRFVEITYPRTTEWSLRDYADGVLGALRSAGIRRGWLLGESFGSQVVWQILRISAISDADRFLIDGIILSGGFVRHPMPWIVPLVQRMNRKVPISGLKAFCGLYAFYAKFRHRRARETLCCIDEFVARRTVEVDRQAIAHRYTLIRESDFCDLVSRTSVPIFQLTGFFDPIVPWLFVRRWLKRNCAAYAGWKLIWSADHNVLGSAPAAAARQVLDWVSRGN